MSLHRLLLKTAICLTLAGPTCAQDFAHGSIQMNQVGFLTLGPKRTTAVETGQAPLASRVINANDEVVVQGETRPRSFDRTADLSVHDLDFSTARTAGSGYRLEVGAQTSRPFAVAGRPFQTRDRDSLIFFYLNRSNIPIAAAHVERADLARPAGHALDRATCFAGPDFRGNIWPGCDYNAGRLGRMVRCGRSRQTCRQRRHRGLDPVERL